MECVYGVAKHQIWLRDFHVECLVHSISRNIFYFTCLFVLSIVALRCLLVSAAQHSEPARYIHTSSPFWISFPFRSPQSTEFPVLCFGVWLVIYFIHISVHMSIAIFQFIFQDGASGKGSACQCRSWRRRRFDCWVEKILWRSKYQPTPVFLPGKSHRQKSLVGYSPWGCKDSDTAEQQKAFMWFLFPPFGFNELKSTFLKFPPNFALALRPHRWWLLYH